MKTAIISAERKLNKYTVLGKVYLWQFSDKDRGVSYITWPSF